MALEGETTGSTDLVLEDVEDCYCCGDKPRFGVYSSAAGYYLGYACCQHYSRESGYYPTHEEAEEAKEDFIPR